MAFESNEDYKQAMNRKYSIGKQTAQVVTEQTPSCFRCGDIEHLSYECNERRISKEKQAAIERFAVVQNKFSYRHGKESSYAEALKRNRSQSKPRRQEYADKKPTDRDSRE